ncbi:sigma-70 family RNA polymerase sigma factor [bacterium]|nr:sigma-70 family RNA polymerase sigma factor [bacterium]
MPAQDWCVERYRPLLRLHARQLRLGRLHRARFDTSDVVHEAIVRALERLDQCRGETEAERVGWLRAILENRLKEMLDRDYAGKRDLRRERSLDAAVGRTDTPLGAYLTAAGPGVSSLVVRQEEVLQLAAAVEELPEDEKDVLVAHCVLGLRVAEVAARVGRTEKAVAMLLYRAKLRLRAKLAPREARA